MIAAAHAHDSEPSKHGLAFLEALESKHNQVLDDLEALNTRIETVLDSYAQSRKSASSDSGQAESGRVA